MKKTTIKISLFTALTVLSFSCGEHKETKEENANTEKLSGSIGIDGSSTVFPITEAVAEEFMKEMKDVKVTVGLSGTGGGFKKFSRGETDINDASRPIKTPEDSACKANNIGHQELMIAYDGLAVVVSPENTWCKDMTVAE